MQNLNKAFPKQFLWMGGRIDGVTMEDVEAMEKYCKPLTLLFNTDKQGNELDGESLKTIIKCCVVPTIVKIIGQLVTFDGMDFNELQSSNVTILCHEATIVSFKNVHFEPNDHLKIPHLYNLELIASTIGNISETVFKQGSGTLFLLSMFDFSNIHQITGYDDVCILYDDVDGIPSNWSGFPKSLSKLRIEHRTNISFSSDPFKIKNIVIPAMKINNMIRHFSSLYEFILRLYNDKLDGPINIVSLFMLNIKQFTFRVDSSQADLTEALFILHMSLNSTPFTCVDEVVELQEKLIDTGLSKYAR